jgi:hypothetical protein
MSKNKKTKARLRAFSYAKLDGYIANRIGWAVDAWLRHAKNWIDIDAKNCFTKEGYEDYVRYNPE